MKTKLLIVLMAAALMLTISGTTQAVTLHPGPGLWKNFNWEVGTSYKPQIDPGTGLPVSLDGRYYFRNAGATYWTEERGFLSYDNTNAGHYLFIGNAGQPQPGHSALDDLDITLPPNGLAGEDTWGLFEMRQLELGQVISPAINPLGEIGPASPQDIYWNAGDNGEWVRGSLWGLQDQAIEFLTDTDLRIWATGGMGTLYVENTNTPNPQDGSAFPDPSLLDRTDPARIPGWNSAGSELWFEGESDYFRFSGFFDQFGIPDGDTEIFFDVTGGSIFDPGISYFEEFWDTAIPPDFPTFGDDGWSQLKQTWNIGDPISFANGWIGSEDTAKGIYTVIPEPVTMLGVFLGVSSLTGYLRRRKLV